MHAVKHALLFKVGDVLVHGGQAFQLHAAGDLLEGGGVTVAGHKRLEEVENLFLSTSNSHGEHYSE
jgi:hypothetical protein